MAGTGRAEWGHLSETKLVRNGSSEIVLMTVTDTEAEDSLETL